MSKDYTLNPVVKYEPTHYSEFISVWDSALADARITQYTELGLPQIDLTSMTMGMESPHALGMYVDKFAYRTLARATGLLRDAGKVRQTDKTKGAIEGHPGVFTIYEHAVAPCEKIITNGAPTLQRTKSAARLMVASYLNDTPGSCEIKVIAIGNDPAKPDVVLSRAMPQTPIFDIGMLVPTTVDYERMEEYFENLGMVSPHDDPTKAIAQLLQGSKSS